MAAAAENAARELRFAFFGDSICVGQGVSPHKTWAARLSAQVEAQLAQAARTAISPTRTARGASVC